MYISFLIWTALLIQDSGSGSGIEAADGYTRREPLEKAGALIDRETWMDSQTRQQDERETTQLQNSMRDGLAVPFQRLGGELYLVMIFG